MRLRTPAFPHPGAHWGRLRGGGGGCGGRGPLLGEHQRLLLATTNIRGDASPRTRQLSPRKKPVFAHANMLAIMQNAAHFPGLTGNACCIRKHVLHAAADRRFPAEEMTRVHFSSPASERWAGGTCVFG